MEKWRVRMEVEIEWRSGGFELRSGGLVESGGCVGFKWSSGGLIGSGGCVELQVPRLNGKVAG